MVIFSVPVLFPRESLFDFDDLGLLIGESGLNGLKVTLELGLDVCQFIVVCLENLDALLLVELTRAHVPVPCFDRLY